MCALQPSACRSCQPTCALLLRVAVRPGAPPPLTPPSRPRTTSSALQMQMQRRRLLQLQLHDLLTYVSWHASLLVACPSTSHSLAPARTQLNANNEGDAEHAPPGGLAELLGMSLDPPARRSAHSPFSTACRKARIAWLSAHNRLSSCFQRAPAQPSPSASVFVNTAHRPHPACCSGHAGIISVGGCRAYSPSYARRQCIWSSSLRCWRAGRVNTLRIPAQLPSWCAPGAPRASPCVTHAFVPRRAAAACLEGPGARGPALCLADQPTPPGAPTHLRASRSRLRAAGIIFRALCGTEERSEGRAAASRPPAAQLLRSRGAPLHPLAPRSLAPRTERACASRSSKHSCAWCAARGGTAPSTAKPHLLIQVPAR